MHSSETINHSKWFRAFSLAYLSKEEQGSKMCLFCVYIHKYKLRN